MASFIVLTPSRNGQKDESKAVFVRDGFAVLAFILPVPWLLFRRLWFEAGLVLAAMIAISMVGSITGHGDMSTAVTLLLCLLIGMEANNWRTARFERKGFEQRAVIDAENVIDAETVYFHANDVPAALPAERPRLQDGAHLQTGAAKPLSGGMLGLVSHRGED
ncbi:MAG: DUF2628 domain-containing protein [Phyllobacterium sp.]